MSRRYIVILGLLFGLVSYCLVLLVSMDAPVFTLELMGTLSLAVISISICILWRREDVTSDNVTEITPDCEKPHEEKPN